MYTLSESGVVFGAKHIPNDPRNEDWKDYQAWLALGNTPAPIPAAVVQTIDEEYDALSDWMKEALGPAAAAKAAVVARRNA